MILFIILLLIIFFLAKRIDWIAKWYIKIISYPYNYYTLLGFLIVGFFAQLDYTDRWGCIIIGNESIFDFKNILFSTISILLILSSFFVRHRTQKIVILIVELSYWIFKLFYFKGGYSVSFLGTADPIISFYDTATLALRLFILTELLKSEIKIFYIIITTLAIMTIKVFIFPIQLNMFVLERESLKRAELTTQKLTGKWSGIYEYDTTYINTNKRNHIFDSIEIRFDSKSIMLYDFRGLDSILLKTEFESEFEGFFHTGLKDDWDNDYDFYIRNIDSNSLDILLEHSLINYEFKMTKINATQQ